MFLKQLHWFHIKDNISLQECFFFKSVNQYFPLMLKLGRHISQALTNFEKVTKLECHTKKHRRELKQTMTAIALRILQNKGSNWHLTMAPSLCLDTYISWLSPTKQQCEITKICIAWEQKFLSFHLQCWYWGVVLKESGKHIHLFAKF